MFFYASKVFWAVAQPLSVIVLLVLAGAAFTILRKRRTAIVAQVLALGLVIVSGFTTTGALMIQPLENRFPRPQMLAEVSAIIVLGGATLSRIGGARGVPELNQAGDRMTAALALARRYPEAPIVFSGGIGTIIAEGETEAETAGRFFAEQGIDASRLVLEDQARNTEENAQLIASLTEDGDLPALLVTSAFHMPRSMGLFRKAGMTIVPWPVDYRSTGREGFGFDITNPLLNLEVVTVAMREWIGLAAYHWTGRIDELFPGP